MAAAGFNPGRILPVVLDVGTSNRVLKDDPLYLGLNQDRMSGPEYFEVCFSSMKGSQCTSLQVSRSKSPVSCLLPRICLYLYLYIAHSWTLPLQTLREARNPVTVLKPSLHDAAADGDLQQQ